MPLHYEILNSEFVDLTTVKRILKDKPKKDMTYEQKLAYENAKDFSKLTDKKADELIAELRGLGMAKLTDDLIPKLIDLLPLTIDDLKLLLISVKVSFKKEELDQIIEVVKKYA